MGDMISGRALSSADAGRLAATAPLRRLRATRSTSAIKKPESPRTPTEERLKVGTTKRLMLADRRARQLGRSAARRKAPRYDGAEFSMSVTQFYSDCAEALVASED